MEKVIELALPCPKAKFECTKMGEMTNDEPQPLSNAVEIIVLSDDDTDEDNDSRLKEWNNAEYFDEILDFKVWMRGESIESAVLLTTLLPHVNT
ncbi:hypothetical protein IGI04_007067 [Brassica rapa subsp. trilocularis]|uniref:FBD domain-containing protein n=1 Tax=Brassica rapa subsp. trilocularis TaxID=1813537 RepID=A0ABQ7NIN6_BRACM|nr:hypothetical protein IGI04_007067 [Brassica rapa subsp. trilocularis]